MSYKFVKNRTYKHINNRDVVFLVREIDNYSEDGTTLRGLWMRITPMNKLHELCVDVITIRSTDVDNWNVYNEGALDEQIG